MVQRMDPQLLWELYYKMDAESKHEDVLVEDINLEEIVEFLYNKKET